MYQVGNKPYINLNYSFYALIPASIDEPLALRLVSYYQDRLEEDLSAHDKIEFEIAFSSYDFMTEKNTRKLLEACSLQPQQPVFLFLFRHTLPCKETRGSQLSCGNSMSASFVSFMRSLFQVGAGNSFISISSIILLTP